MKTFIKKVKYKLVQWYEGYIKRSPDALLALRWISENRQHDFRHRYDLGENAVIFDCGGYDGEWANKMALMYPSASIYIFEVVPSYCAALNDRFSGNKNIHVFDFGLGKSDGSIDIAVDGVASSEFLTKEDTKSVTGRIKKFGSFIHEHDLHQIDLLKMNIEGGEYDLLISILDDNFALNCLNIQVQFHNYGQWCVEKRELIRKRLKVTHFLTYDFAWNFENWQKKNNLG